MLIAHDLGTTGNKASLHDDTGCLLSSTTTRYDTYFTRGASPSKIRWIGGGPSARQPAIFLPQPTSMLPASQPSASPDR